jgi:hypothetical protein
LNGRREQIESPAVTEQHLFDQLSCEELGLLIRGAFAAMAEARRIRRLRDVWFQEDLRLSRDEHAQLDRVIKHLLVGHEGQPCPAGGRPIVRDVKAWDRADLAMRGKRMKTYSVIPRRCESA